MKNRETRTMTSQKRAYEQFAKHLIRFLAKQQWRVAAVGESQIRRPDNWPRFNYEFVANFTGNLMPPPSLKKPKKKKARA